MTCTYPCVLHHKGCYIAAIDEPEELNMCQARVLDYLKQFIGNMKTEDLRRFLRFTTGSSVLLV